MAKERIKSLDFKGFAAAFGEAFDARGFAAGFRSAFDLRDAARGFAAGFRDGAALVAGHLRQAVAAMHAGARHEDVVQGQLLLQRLLADMAGGGGAAVRALGEIRKLLRPFNPQIDAIPDDHIPGIVKRLIEDLRKPAARPEDFSGAVARALTEAQARAAELEFAAAAQVLDNALRLTTAEDQGRAKGRAALLAERGRIALLQLRYRDAAAFYHQAANIVGFDPQECWSHQLEAASAHFAQAKEFGNNRALSSLLISNVVVDGRRTSIRLEPVMWDALRDIAQRLNMTIHDLVTEIERERTGSSLTAAIRVYVVDFYRAAAWEADTTKPRPARERQRSSRARARTLH